MTKNKEIEKVRKEYEEFCEDLLFEPDNYSDYEKSDEYKIWLWIEEQLLKQREELVGEFKNLLDEFNEMDDDQIPFEIRIKRPIQFVEAINKLKQ